MPIKLVRTKIHVQKYGHNILDQTISNIITIAPQTNTDISNVYLYIFIAMMMIKTFLQN
jgi:hypothetical protein